MQHQDGGGRAGQLGAVEPLIWRSQHPVDAGHEAFGKAEKSEVLRDPSNPSLGYEIRRRRTDRNLVRSAEQVHDAIVTVATFLRAKDVLAGSRKPANGREPREKSIGRASEPYIFRGLVRCAHYGRRMEGWRLAGKAARYRCKSRGLDEASAAKHPASLSIGEPVLAAEVSAWVQQLLAPENLADTVERLTAVFAAGDALQPARVRRAKDAEASARLRLRRLQEAIEAGVDPSSMVERIATVKRELDAASAVVEEMLALPEARSGERVAALLGRLAEHGREVFEEADPAELHTFYRALGLELVVDGDAGSVAASVTPDGAGPVVGMSFGF